MRLICKLKTVRKPALVLRDRIDQAGQQAMGHSLILGNLVDNRGDFAVDKDLVFKQ